MGAVKDVATRRGLTVVRAARLGNHEVIVSLLDGAGNGG